MKNLILLLLGLSAFFSQAQISTIQVNKSSSDELTKMEYDSLEGEFQGDKKSDLGKLIGQELYLKPKSSSFDIQMGYKGFIKDYKINQYEKSNVYRCCSTYDGSRADKYDGIGDKYYTVLAVYKIISSSNFANYFLKLSRKDNGEICYYSYSYSLTSDFIVVGYYEKQKELLRDKEFVMRKRRFGKFIDINTGKEVAINPGKIYKCINFGVDPEQSNPSMVLEGENKELILLPISWLKYKMYAIEKSEALNYSSRFGIHIWDQILQNEVEIGMTEEMVLLAWGIPSKINPTELKEVKSEQWVYEQRGYIYFKNGIVDAIQKN